MSAACPEAAPPPPEATTAAPDTSAIREAAKARVAAIASGDIEGYLAAYDDQAVWIPPLVEQIAGKAAARQRLAGALKDVRIEITALPEEYVAMSSDWVLERGRYATMRTPAVGGEPEQVVGSYVAVWRRQTDGAFRIAYDIWNSDRSHPAEQGNAASQSP
jgi:ketosteroid isomerase-like protein